MSGPLAGLKVVELAAIGPAPFVCMMLSDLGADIVRVERPGAPLDDNDPTCRGRAARIGLDMKQDGDLERLRALLKCADVMVEGFRPGVLERLGLDPERLLADNPRLVVTRVTGWGQTGPLAPRAGHDINYIAITGALHAIGAADAPLAPLNLVGDYGGGAMLAMAGLLAALYERSQSGCGQVVDAAMTDGAALLMSFIYGMKGGGRWRDRRADNILDGAAPFYGVYACRDGRHLAVGPIEPQFYAQFLKVLGIEPESVRQMDRADWPRQRDRVAALIAARDRDEWVALFEGLDACVAPVLSMGEAPHHPHNAARGTFVDRVGFAEPAPAPRFSRTPGAVAPQGTGSYADVLAAWHTR